MTNRRVDVKVRVTPEQHAQLVAAARSLGLSLSDYMAFKAIGDARDQAIFERMDALEGALASALEASRDAIAADVKTTLDAQGDKIVGVVNRGWRRVHDLLGQGAKPAEAQTESEGD